MGSYRPFVIFFFCVLACLGVVSFITEYTKKRMASYQQDLLDNSFLVDLDSSNEALLQDTTHEASRNINGNLIGLILEKP